MSDIRMCDNCGNIFSVNEYGWEQYQKTTADGNPKPRQELRPGYPNMADAAVRAGVNYHNAVNHGAATFHTCAQCAQGEGPVIRPRVQMAELPSGKVTSSSKEVETAYEIEEGELL